MRGLTGALINNIQLMKNRIMGLFALAALASVVLYFVTDVEHFRTAALLSLVVIPICAMGSATISFNSKWTAFERIWDVSPVVMILSRYITFVVISLVLCGLWIISPLHDGDWQNILDAVTIVLATGALYYPLSYGLNADKEEINNFVLMGSVAGAFWGGGELARHFFSGHEYPSVVFFTVVLGIYLVSLVLSVAFNRFHMGRAV